MSTVDDATVRLGLALYRQTILEGPSHYSVESLVFGQLQKEIPGGLFQRLFNERDFDFWGKQEELAKKLAQSGIADHYSRAADGAFHRDHFVRWPSSRQRRRPPSQRREWRRLFPAA